MLTKTLLQSLVDYDHKTGILTHKKPYRVINRPSKGYLYKRILGKKYLVHQLAFMYMDGYIPKLIDHIDGNIQNNSWKNLRDTNKSINALNTTKSVGVYKSGNKWLAKCMTKGILNYLGTFETREQAKKVYEDFRKNFI